MTSELETLKETPAAELSDRLVRDLVDRGAKLSKEISTMEKKKAELEQIKTILRKRARGKNAQFAGSDGAIARVEQKPNATARVVEACLVARIAKMCGDQLTTLFTLHPSKGGETNFTLNCLKTLPKRTAQAVVEMLTVPATAWVRFS